MTTFLQFGVGGLNLGSVYALLAIGWIVVYRASGVLNVAQGGMLVVSGLVGWTVYQHAGGFAGAVAAAAACGVVFALVLDRLLSILLLHTDPFGSVILTLGVAEIISGVIQSIWGTQGQLLNGIFPEPPLVLGGVAVTYQDIVLWSVTALLFIVLSLLSGRTLLGRAIELVAVAPDGARLAGIPAQMIRVAAFAVAGATAGVGGICLVTVTPLSGSQVISLSIAGFIAAVLGSWRYPAACITGVGLGLLGSYLSGYVNGAWSQTYVYVAVALYLSVVGLRPNADRLNAL